MNEKQLRRLIQRLIVLSAPLPLALFGGACGGSMTEGGGDDGGTAGSAPQTGGSGGSSAGAGGTTAGSAGTFTTAGSAGAPVDCRGSAQATGCTPVVSVAPRHCLDPLPPTLGQSLPTEKCNAVCGPSFAPCTLNAVDLTTISVLCEPGCAIGRRPAGLSSGALCDGRAIGSYFAEIAHLEAASVTAFRSLREQLRAVGAPKALLRAAGRAARDEVRHARTTSALARRFGGTPRRPAIAPTAPPSLEAIALENAVEGCVRETFGALLATHQAEHAREPHIRAAMKRIARDETQHAALSWRIARFLDGKLTAEARRKVAAARSAAARDLLESLAREPAVAFAAQAGLPSPGESLRLARSMESALWS